LREDKPRLELNSITSFSGWVFKQPPKEVKASGGCHGIGKEFLRDVSLKPSPPCDNG